MLLSQNGDVGENYCIGGNCEKTNQEILSLICNFLDKKIPKNKSYLDQITYVKDRPGHDRRYFINTKKINIELGWENSFTFEKGIEITINWYLNNLNWCEKILKKHSYKGERIGSLK